MTPAPSRLDAGIEAMRLYFPSFSLSGLPLGTGPMAVWKGRVRPIERPAGLEELLDDIEHERPVLMQAGGAIEHRPDCVATHCRHDWMDELSDPFVEYKLEVHYGGGEAHPRAYVREPLVPLLVKRRTHHLADGALCAYPPWVGVWQWQRDTVVQFMAHAVEWLVKWTVWAQTRRWLGPEMPHDLGFLLRQIRPEQECYCGSGKQYGLCHRPGDEATARGAASTLPGLAVPVVHTPHRPIAS